MIKQWTTLLLLVLLCLHNNVAQAQVNCQNIDFEYGDFTYWQGYTGFNTITGDPISAPGLVPGRHTIMNDPLATDPYSYGEIPVVSPHGGSYSIRLGNDGTGSQAEKISRTVTVTAQNPYLIYEYAVVMQAPNHPISQNPRFKLQILDANGDSIPGPCYNYEVFGTGNLPGFKVFYGNMVNTPSEFVCYRNWTPVALDLTAYIGQTITLEFSTYDCLRQGHFGYAYIDLHCTNIEIQKYQCDNDTVVISMPDGFTDFLWNTGDTTQFIKLYNPPDGSTYSVTATTESGCSSNFQIVLSNTNPTTTLPPITAVYCSEDNVISLTAPNGFADYLWSTGDTGKIVNVYNVSVGDTLSVLLYNGIQCNQTLYFIVDSLPEINSSPVSLLQYMCTYNGTGYIFGPQGYKEYLWSTGDTVINPYLINMVADQIVTLRATPFGGSCPVIFKYAVEVNEGLSEVTTPIEICENKTNAFIGLGFPSGELAFDFAWSTGDSTQFITVANPVIGDTFTFYYRGNFGCMNINHFVFTEKAHISDTVFSLLNACPGLNAITLYAPTGFYVGYLWPDSSTFSSKTITNPQNNESIVLRLTDFAGCNDYAIYNVNLYNSFPDSLTITQDNFCATTKSLNLYAPSGYSYLWSTGTTSQSIIINPPILNSQYYVVIADTNMCYDTLYYTPVITTLPPVITIDAIPNIFTPNGDGINEDFGIVADSYDFFEFFIYNRWGTLLFSSTHSDDRWNGEIAKSEAPAGAYFYIANIKACGKSQLVQYKGVVNLLRD